MAISIVIPVLNEAAVLPTLLSQLRPLRDRGVEIVVADGGSDDASFQIGRRMASTALRAPAGRARQMNAGAEIARGDVLLFLHADTLLPPDADRLVEAALSTGEHDWGRFDVRICSRSPLLGMVARLMNLRSRLTGIATGDQAMFVRRSAFEAVGRFPDQPLMEDIELSRRLLKLSRPTCLRDRVITSGRRWDARGVLRTVLLMWRLRWAYWRGASPSDLAREYQ